MTFEKALPELPDQYVLINFQETERDGKESIFGAKDHDDYHENVDFLTRLLSSTVWLPAVVDLSKGYKRLNPKINFVKIRKIGNRGNIVWIQVIQSNICHQKSEF